MSSEVIMSVPSDFAANIQARAEGSGKSVAETLRSVISAQHEPITMMEDWSDEAVLRAADIQMPAAQSARHSELLQLNQRGVLTPDEREELANLHENYMAGNLHKARGMLEAVRRGLRAAPST